ncbi:DUF5655 domain-containing protein [Microbacterium hydrocarbonoxydans]|uniref:DUF5655 domain-containing protein n=1 Tax=Microbacterium hydrocarbonoxydans TaxID=273678 RepID=UPI00350E33EB
MEPLSLHHERSTDGRFCRDEGTAELFTIKEVVHPSPRTWMHHIELRSVTDVDEELLGWVVQAYQEAA